MYVCVQFHLFFKRISARKQVLLVLHNSSCSVLTQSNIKIQGYLDWIVSLVKYRFFDRDFQATDPDLSLSLSRLSIFNPCKPTFFFLFESYQSLIFDTREKYTRILLLRYSIVIDARRTLKRKSEFMKYQKYNIQREILLYKRNDIRFFSIFESKEYRKLKY